MGDRYEIGLGEYGVYFYDNHEKRDLKLNEVRAKLNKHSIMHEALSYANDDLKQLKKGSDDELQDEKS